MSHYLSIRGIGQPIAYFPQLSIYLGCVKAGIFLGQMVFWHDKTENPLGVYKTAEEITKETGLSYKEQLTARKKLTNLDLITETYKRLDHRLFFKFNVERFDEWFSEMILANDQSSISRNAVSEVREESKGKFVIQKNTTENTTDTHSSVDAVLNLWTPDLNSLNAWLVRSGEKPMTANEVAIMLPHINSHYELKLRSGLITSNQMYSNFVKWIKGDYKKYRSAPKQQQQQPQNNSRDVNTAWRAQEVQHTPVAVDDIDLGDFK